MSYAARLLEEKLREAARARESTVVRFDLFVVAAGAALNFILAPSTGAELAHWLGIFLVALTFYFAVVTAVLTSGRYHPALSWTNTFMEVSAPAFIFALDTHFRGPEWALSAPPQFAWTMLIVVAAARANRLLAALAGTVAAVEYLVLYLVFAVPKLAPDAPLTMSLPYVAIRGFFFICTGVLTALFADYVLKRANEALQSVRAQEFAGKYFLHERVGLGGMAEVFRATYSPEGGFEKIVAVKRVLAAYAQEKEFVTLFRTEAQLCSTFNHPNVVQVLDMGRAADTYYLAMEFVDGVSLHALLRTLSEQGRQLPVCAVTYLGAELCSALDYLHNRTDKAGEPLNLVHRDVNPPNVLLSKLGEVKLADFGIVHARRAARITEEGSVRGKMGYMAPEQAVNDAIDGRTDLFALGLTLHEALTGKMALTGPTPTALMKASFQQRVPKASSARADVPKELDEILTALVEIEPRDRVQTALAARKLLLALEGAAAPYPNGRAELMRIVRSTSPPRAG